MISELKNKYPSICYECKKARKPASLENFQNGFVGCILIRECDMKNVSFVSSDISEYESIGTGWVSVSYILDEDIDETMANDQLITRCVKKCKHFK